VAVFAIAAIALVAFAGPDLAASRKLPVTIRLDRMEQSTLLEANGVPVRLRLRRTGRVRVAVSLRFEDGRRLRLGSIRRLRLARKRSRSVTVRLSRAGRASLAGCPQGSIVVTVSGLRRRRSSSRPLELDPPDCGRFFAPQTFWNAPLPAAAPLDPDSAAVTGDLVRKVRDGYASNLPPTINTAAYSPPVYTVGPRQARVRVVLAPGHAPDLQAAFAAVPLPAGARGAAGSDGEAVIWQPATDTLWEFWQLRLSAGGWHAAWGGRMDGVSSGPGFFPAQRPNWGTAATGLPLVGGLITPRELRSGRIDHVLSLGVPKTRRGDFSRPARRTDGVSPCAHAVPEGARFRLDPALDIDSLGLPPAVAALAHAAQQYGIVVRDQSGSVAFYAQNASSLPSDPYPALFGGKAPWDLLAQFPWSRLQLVRMHLARMPGQPGPSLLGDCG
jgi:hypothetical protein